MFWFPVLPAPEASVFALGRRTCPRCSTTIGKNRTCIENARFVRKIYLSYTMIRAVAGGEAAGNTPRCQRQFLAAPAPSGSELELVGASRTTVLSSYTAETGVHTRHGHLSQKRKHGKRIVKDSNSKTRCHGVLFWYSYPSSGSFLDGLLTWQSDRGDDTAHRRPPELEIFLRDEVKGPTWWPVGGRTLCYKDKMQCSFGIFFQIMNSSNR